jgi:hypothetical protein
MANGPLGGFMPTPPAPAQPPQLSLNTSAESRGNFKNFLSALPSNGAMTPTQTGVGQSSPAPVSPIAGNVNIFQPQMTQMPMPMLSPPAMPQQMNQPVQTMQEGGFVEEFDPGISYDTSDPSIGGLGGFGGTGGTQEEFQAAISSDGSGGISFADDSAGGEDIVTGGQPLVSPGVDTRPVTNIRNVGADSNLRYDPQFALSSFARGAGMSPQSLLDRGYGAQFGIGQDTSVPALSSALPTSQTNITSSNKNLLGSQNLLDADITPDAIAPGFRGQSRIRGIPAGQQPLSLGLETDLLTQQPPIDTRFTFPETFNLGARTPAVVDPLSSDLINAIRRGEAGQYVPFTNNPANLKTGPEGLTTEVVKTLPPGDLRAGQQNPLGILAPAIFSSPEAGQASLDRQLSLYGSRDNITTPAALTEKYLGAGTKENPQANKDAYTKAIRAVAGDKFDLTDPAVRSNISNALIRQEIGQSGERALADKIAGRNVLTGLDTSQVSFNPAVVSDAGQLRDIASAEAGTTTAPITQNQIPIPPIGEQRAESRGEIPALNPFGRARPDLVTDREGDVTSEIAGRNLDAAKAIAERGFPVSVNEITGRPEIAPTVDNLLRLGQEAQQRRNFQRALIPDRSLETLEGRRDRLPDQVLDIDTRSVQPTSESEGVRELLERGRLAQQDRDAAALALGIGTPPIDKTNLQSITALGGRGTSPTTNLFRGPDESIVGDDERFAELNVGDIPGDVTQEAVADILNRPDRFPGTFKIGDVELPNIFATLANKAGSFFDRRLFDGIVKKGLSPVVDKDTGRITGATDARGNLVEGMDFNRIVEETGESDDPILRFIKKATDEKEDDKDTTPNVIGGAETEGDTPAPRQTVVASPFAPSTASFTPTGFSSGNLNRLIEQITGVRAPTQLQEGGVVNAVDNFLSNVA